MVGLNQLKQVSEIETRYTVTGEADARRAMDGIATAHDKIGQAAQASASTTEQAANRQLSVLKRLESEAKKVDQQLRSQSAFDRSASVFNQGFDQNYLSQQRRDQLIDMARTKYLPNANDNLDARANALRSATNPLFDSMSRLKDTTREADKLLKHNAITQEEHTAAVMGAAKAHSDLEKRVAASSRAAGLSEHDWKNLSFQLNDAVTMMASGSSAMQVLSTQSGQVFQVLQNHPGGVAGAFSGLASAGGVATAGVLALVAALGGGVAAYGAFDAAQRSTQRSLMGSGRAAGLTPGDVQDIAARSPLSDRLGSRLAGDLAASGNADRAGITKALGITRDLAGTMGTDFDTAGKALTDLATNGVSSLDKLNERYRFLGAAQRQHIIDLENEGKGTQAFRESLDALSTGLGTYGDTTSFTTRAMDRFYGGLSNIRSGIDTTAAKIFGDDRAGSGLQTLQAQRATLANEASALTRQLNDIEASRKKSFGGALNDSMLEDLYPADRIRLRLDEIGKAQEDLTRRITNATQAQITAQRAAAAETERMQRERITSVTIALERENSVTKLNPIEQRTVSAQRQAGVYEESDFATAMKRYGDAYQPYVSKRDRWGDSYSDPVMPKGMPTPVVPSGRASMFDDAAKADSAYYKSRIAADVQEGSRITQDKAVTEATRSSTLALDAQSDALGKNAGAQAAAAQKASMRISLGQQGTPIDESITKRINEQADAYGKLVQQIAEANLKKDFAFERRLTTMDPGEANIASRLRPVFGDNLDDPGAKAAAGYARATQSILDTQRAMSSLASMSSSLIDPLLDPTKKWSDAFSDLSRNIAKAALQAALFGQGPFASFFGTQGAGQGVGGLAGGFAKLIGFDSGGYTGPGGRYDVAGLVHRDEIVWSKSDISRAGGIGVVEGMRLGFRGYADGGVVTDPHGPDRHARMAGAYDPTPEVGEECFFDVRIAA